MVLHPVDYAVIAVYLIAIVAFGSWFARFQRSTTDYFLTGRTVPWWAICFTIVATETSTLSFIGVPAASFTGNMTFLQLAMGYVTGRVLVSVLFVPAYFRGELFTSYELLQLRFGSAVKTVAAGLFLITRSLADGIRLFATALVISVVTALPVGWVVTILGISMMVYTVRGGVSAVIWTDVIQMFVYLAGALVVFAALLARIPGGWTEVVAVGAAAGKFRVFDFSWNPQTVYTLWTGLIGGVALTLATHGTDQYLVQRLLAGRSERDAKIGLVLSGFLVFAQFGLFLLIGVMLFTYYRHVSPPPMQRTDQVLPLFVVNTLSGGVAGFIVAAVVAAALSPSLNAMAATTVNDFYRRYRPDADDALLMRASRLATVLWGVVQLIVALAAQRMDRSVLEAGLGVLSLSSGPVLAAFLLGVRGWATSARAVLIGMAVGLSVVGWVWWTDSAAWTWYVFVGGSVTAIVAVILGTTANDARRSASWESRRAGARGPTRTS